MDFIKIVILPMVALMLVIFAMGYFVHVYDEDSRAKFIADCESGGGVIQSTFTSRGEINTCIKG